MHSAALMVEILNDVIFGSSVECSINLSREAVSWEEYLRRRNEMSWKTTNFIDGLAILVVLLIRKPWRSRLLRFVESNKAKAKKKQ